MTVGDLAPLHINDFFQPKIAWMERQKWSYDKSSCQKTLVKFVDKNRLKVTQKWTDDKAVIKKPL
jgi:hypothetical protein